MDGLVQMTFLFNSHCGPYEIQKSPNEKMCISIFKGTCWVISRFYVNFQGCSTRRAPVKAVIHGVIT